MKRILSIILAISLVLSLMVGCTPKENHKPAGQSDVAESKTQDTVIIANRREPKTLNPHASNDTGTSFITALIYDTLLTFDKDMKLQPNLATKWEKINDTLYRFELRKDVVFHNGDKLTPQDVINTFELAGKSPATASTLGVIDVAASKVVNDYTVEIALKKPYAPFLNVMALSISSIVNKDAIEEAGDKYDENPIGTGPLMYKSWKAGDMMELKAFDKYWGQKPSFNNIVIRLIPEATTRAIEVETGGVDIALGIIDNDTKKFKDNPNVSVVSTNILNTSYLSFNCSKEPFNNVKVRQAITHAIDATTIVNNSTFGLAEQSFSVIAPGVFGYHNPGVKFEYNIDKAKALLKEAGYPDGFKTTLTANGDDMAAEMIQNMLKQIGITVEIKSVDFANWLDALVNGKQEMYIGGWTVPSADAAEGLEAFHSGNHGSGGNRSFYTNHELDKILESAAEEMDSAKRIELYKQAQEMIAEEAVYVNLKVGQMHVVTNPRIENVYAMPTQGIKLWLLTFK